MQKPIVFISYSWDSEEHKEWVKSIADRLLSDGFSVLFDRYDLYSGKNKNSYMEKSIACAHKVIIIMTPEYRQKADMRQKGVGYEADMVSNDISENQETTKFVPVLRGDSKTSIPRLLKSRIYVDMCDDSKFEERYKDLKSALLRDFMSERESAEEDDLSAYYTYSGGSIPSIEILKFRLSAKAAAAQKNANYLEVIQVKLMIAEICNQQGKKDDAYMLEQGVRSAYAHLTAQEKYKAKQFIIDYNRDMAMYIDQDIAMSGF